MKATFEVEIDGPRNNCLAFLPLQKRVRGRFDFARETEPQAGVMRGEWPQPIPGQIIGIDGAMGYIREPLHDEEHADAKEKIESRGMKLPDEREEFDSIDVVTWAFWLQRAVDAGLARIISGTMPKIEGEVKMSFFVERQPSEAEQLTGLIKTQNELLAKLLAKMEGN
ncbi:MAG: hypothetical protein IID44_07190 [Planctomycetes bacterium]|nr:hypothetical protein [Planctomycetota bacterium]